jgi:hypothetical protein
MLALLGVTPALLAGSPVQALPAAGAAADASSVNDEGLMTVLNPAISGKLADRVPLVPPLNSFQDRTIYMINLSWEGPDAANYFYGAMREWFAKHYPSVKMVVKVTSHGMFGGDPAILKEMIANKADAAIVGVAG